MPPPLCESCRHEPAEFTVCRISAGRASDERLLCSRCARDNERVLFGDRGLSLVELLEERLSGGSDGEPSRTKVCPGCGNALDETKQSGMLGCSMCYVAFREEIKPMITELHGYSPSQGKPT